MRTGVALVIVLLMLALTGALAVGGAFVTRHQITMERDVYRGRQLEQVAEQVVVQAVTRWDSAARAAQPIGFAVQLPVVAAGARTDTWITRIGPRTYWLVAESQSDVRPPLRRRIGLLVRLVSGVPQPVPERAWSELP